MPALHTPEDIKLYKTAPAYKSAQEHFRKVLAEKDPTFERKLEEAIKVVMLTKRDKLTELYKTPTPDMVKKLANQALNGFCFAAFCHEFNTRKAFLLKPHEVEKFSGSLVDKARFAPEGPESSIYSTLAALACFAKLHVNIRNGSGERMKGLFEKGYMPEIVKSCGGWLKNIAPGVEDDFCFQIFSNICDGLGKEKEETMERSSNVPEANAQKVETMERSTRMSEKANAQNGGLKSERYRQYALRMEALKPKNKPNNSSRNNVVGGGNQVGG